MRSEPYLASMNEKRFAIVPGYRGVDSPLPTFRPCG